MPPPPANVLHKTYPYSTYQQILVTRLSSSQNRQRAKKRGRQQTRGQTRQQARQQPIRQGQIRGNRQARQQQTGRKTRQQVAKYKLGSQKTRQQAARGQRNGGGYKVSYVKPGSLLDRIRIKKGDTIKQLAGKPVYSKRQIHRQIAAISKKQKGFSLWLERNRKNFLVSYKMSSLKPGRIKIAQVKKMESRRRLFQKSKRRIASASPVKKDSVKKSSVSKKRAQQKEKSSKKTQPPLKMKKTSLPKKKLNQKPLIPKKYQDNLQRAYVIASYSIVYKQANFDSDKIHSLHKGSKVIISKKIFRPAHNFGSFYKVFLSRPKKIVGYVSEVDLAPEFIKKEDEETPNPSYLLARKQLKEGKVLDVGFSPQGSSLFKEKEKEKEGQSSTRSSRHYFGLFAGYSSLQAFQPDTQDILAGFKLSGYGLLISSLNMDINFSLSPYDFKFFHFDVLISLPLMKTHLAQLFVMGGLKFDINKRIKDLEKSNDPGFAGAAALIFPFRSFLLFRLEAKTEYGLASKNVRTGFSAVLQARF